jgi:RNA polymerase sigma-70 factor (ECF subfamily)
MLGPAMAVLRTEAGETTLQHEGALVAELYDLHHDAIRTFARRLLGDHDSAEDLVQEVFVRAPGALRRHRGEATMRTLLLSIAIHLARKHVRSAARRRAAWARAVAEQERSVDTPEQELARRQMALALHSALDALTIEQRVAFVLIEIEERSAAEAARIAGAPEATMRTRLFHAKRRLRDILRKRGIAHAR